MECLLLVELLAHCGVEDSSLDKEVTSAEYREISRYLSQWKLVAPKLNITEEEVEAIENDEKKAEMQRIGFLRTWKQKFSMRATYRILIKALLNIQRAEDARGVCQLLKGISRMIHPCMHARTLCL